MHIKCSNYVMLNESDSYNKFFSFNLTAQIYYVRIECDRTNVYFVIKLTSTLAFTKTLSLRF